MALALDVSFRRRPPVKEPVGFVGLGSMGEPMARNGGVHVGLSTVSPEISRRIAALHRARGSRYVAAPVFGRPDAAAARKLWIYVAGETAAKERVRPVLDRLGQGVFDFGEEPELASTVKLGGNFLIAAALEALAEACALVEKSGVESSAFVEAMGRPGDRGPGGRRPAVAGALRPHGASVT